MKSEPNEKASPTSQRDHQDQHQVRGWSEGDISRKQAFPEEIEPPWGVEHVAQNADEQWGGRAGSKGNDTPSKAPSKRGAAKSKPEIVQVPAPPVTKRSRRSA